MLLHDVPPKSMAQNVEQTSESVIAEKCSYISGKVPKELFLYFMCVFQRLCLRRSK